jgi:pentatricopeptide repeat protein
MLRIPNAKSRRLRLACVLLLCLADLAGGFGVRYRHTFSGRKRQRIRIAAATSTSNRASTLSESGQPLEREIATLGRKGYTDRALAVLESIPTPTLRQVNAAIDACGRARNVRLDRAFELFHSYKHLQPNVYTFGALMTVCARAHNMDRAMQLFATMKTCQVQPNGVVYNAAISACQNTARSDLATKLLAQAASENIYISVVGYNAAIGGVPTCDCVVGQNEIR